MSSMITKITCVDDAVWSFISGTTRAAICVQRVKMDRWHLHAHVRFCLVAGSNGTIEYPTGQAGTAHTTAVDAIHGCKRWEIL